MIVAVLIGSGGSSWKSNSRMSSGHALAVPAASPSVRVAAIAIRRTMAIGYERPSRRACRFTRGSRRSIAQICRDHPLDLEDVDAEPPGVVLDLVLADPADGEVARVGG